jgi:hypothetical protein
MRETERSHAAKLLVIELNEFEPEHLRKAAERLGLPNILRVLSLPHASTTTDDLIEHKGLDPWVQWVNVHTGKPSSVHGVRRLGQTRNQQTEQVWNRLADLGHSWGVWSAMNAPRGPAKGCAFFMPDPWSFEERAYPEHLNDFLDLPRYVGKNYLDLDRGRALIHALRFTRGMIAPQWWGPSFRLVSKMVANLPRTGASVHTFTTLLDYFSTLVFTSLRRRHNPDFSLIFLNCIAHLQHQFWFDIDRMHPEMKIGVRLTDQMLGLLLNNRQPGEALIVVNGL